MVRWLATCATAAIILSPMTAGAQTAEPYHPPRTADGHPDLQGVWATAFMTGLERPDDVKELVLAPKEAAELSKRFHGYVPQVVDPDANFIGDFTLAVVKGGYRSSLIVDPGDGKLPLTAASKEAVAKFNKAPETTFDNPEERDSWERCIIGGGQAPMRPEHGFTPVQIVQTPEAIVIMIEDVGGLRIVNMTGSPPPNAVRSREGYSAGHWEGDTLVIETTHFMPIDRFRSTVDTALILGPQSKVIERYTRVSDTELLEQFTIEDPTLYTKPWLAEYSLTRSDKKTYEYACHEHNYSLTNVLRAARLGRQDKPKGKKS